MSFVRSISAQDTADAAHAILADIHVAHSDGDEGLNDNSNSSTSNAYDAASNSRYVAILDAGAGRFWAKRNR